MSARDDRRVDGMGVPAPVHARYLHLDHGAAILALLHEPARARVRELAVLFCPPFGWEETCSYRRRREWADACAADGYPTLRIDLPSTGDSTGSPYDAARVRAWREAIRASAEWLLATTGARALAAVGIGVGGLVLCDAIGAGAPVDDVVLWAVPSRGGAFVRELRAFARLEAAKTVPEGNGMPGQDRDVAASAGGFVLTHETAASLEQLDVTRIELPPGSPRRALLFARDGIPVDEPLREHLLAGGAAVDVAPGSGYSEMIAPPHEGRPPRGVIEATRAWLAGEPSATSVHMPAPAPRGTRSAVARESRSVSVRESDTIEFACEHGRVRESPMRISQPFGDLFGVLAEPVGAPTLGVAAVLLNAGAHRRIGQGRMWVEAARRWAAAGVPSLRLDLEGIGDSDGDGTRFTDMGELYDERLVAQALSALDALDARGLGPRYVAAGLCSGACWSFHIALNDSRVAAAVMINPQALFWHRSLKTARTIRRGSKLKVLRGEVRLARLAALAAALPGLAGERVRARVRERRGGNELERALDTLCARGKRARFLFSGAEPMREEPYSTRGRHTSWTGVIAAGIMFMLLMVLAVAVSALGVGCSGAGDGDGERARRGGGQVVRMMSTEQGA